MVITYEDISELMVKVTMACSATVEPILISERSAVTTKDTITALNGMFQPGVTCLAVSDVRNEVACVWDSGTTRKWYDGEGQTYVGEES